MTVKQVIDPKTIDDEPHIMRFSPSKKFVSIDTTVTQGDRIDSLLKLRLQFGKSGFASMLQNVERRASAIEQQQQMLKEQRQKQDEVQRKHNNDPEIAFPRAWRSRGANSQRLTEWAETQDVKTITKLLEHYYQPSRIARSPLGDEYVEATHYLEKVIQRKKAQNAVANLKKSVFQRIREKIS